MQLYVSEDIKKKKKKTETTPQQWKLALKIRAWADVGPNIGKKTLCLTLQSNS